MAYGVFKEFVETYTIGIAHSIGFNVQPSCIIIT